MAKKKKKLKLSKLRQIMLKNCNDLVTRFETSKGYLELGEASTKVALNYIKSSTATTQKDNFVSSLKPSDLLVLVHAGLVQEWTIFLESIFGEVVLHYLEISDTSKLPSQRFDLNKVISNNLPDMRRSISIAAKESFSFRPYDKKVQILSHMFEINNSSIILEMKKHVEIRNVFQHNRGIIRSSDLNKIGKKYFELSDENGLKIKYKEDEKIVLSFKEIEHLNKIIQQYSEKFEVLP